jgi:glycerophosphoryl diester phosphodiesterase
MKIIREKPLILGHRGASKVAPENTLSAFQLAVKLGADGVELDAKLSADGQVVVIHDQNVDRTTEGTGLVRELTLKELRELDAGKKFSPQFKGEQIPTLDEVFRGIEGKAIINVELTNYATPGDDLLVKVAELVKKHDISDQIMFSSFLPGNIRRIKKLLPDVPAGLLAPKGLLGALSRSWIGRFYSPDLIHPYFTDVDEGFIQLQHTHKRGVNVWTVDDPKTIRKMIDLGVDGIITDDVSMAWALLKKFSR